MADPGSAGKIRVAAQNSIYTVLLIVATLFMLLGTVFIAWRSVELFGAWLPLGPK